MLLIIVWEEEILLSYSKLLLKQLMKKPLNISTSASIILVLLDENKFSELIEDNNTLFGLHMQGNACVVDGNGFIKYGEINRWIEYSKHSGIFAHKPNGRSSLFEFNPKKINKFVSTTSWWTWEGWSENTFVLKDQI